MILPITILEMQRLNIACKRSNDRRSIDRWFR